MTPAPLTWFAISRRPGGQADQDAGALVTAIMAKVPGLAVRFEDDTLIVLADRPIDLWQTNGGGQAIVVGDIRARAGFAPPGNRTLAEFMPRDVAAGLVAREIVRRTWGSFIAIVRDSGAEGVFADPSGSSPAMVYRTRTVTVAAPDLPPWVWRALEVRPEIAWCAVAAVMLSPAASTFQPMLCGVEIVSPGSILSLLRPGSAQQVWSPLDHARPPVEPDPSPERLRAEVAHVLAAEHGSGPVLIQLSGGLDSSIIASLLPTLGDSGVAAITIATHHAGGDERRYARLAADRAGVPLTIVEAGTRPVDHARFSTIPHQVRPYLYGLDNDFEQAVADAAAEMGATRLVTGQGGDAVFFEMATPYIAADRVRRQGWTGMALRPLLGDAVRCGSSIWPIVGAVMRDSVRWPLAPQALLSPHLLARDVVQAAGRQLTAHPWLDGAETLAPGKRLHLEAIAASQIFFAPRARSDGFAVRHPLLAQPLVEHVLSLPTFSLCYGSADRALARDAHAADLPPEIVARRIKGEASAHYSAGVRADRETLRAIILDGPLVAAGLLDHRAVERALRLESLAVSRDYRALSFHANLSGWAHFWRQV
jgi:asparagine synthase (glutamine-hydrolysing)